MSDTGTEGFVDPDPVLGRRSAGWVVVVVLIVLCGLVTTVLSGSPLLGFWVLVIGAGLSGMLVAAT
ncbi:MAG: hypothetical protein WAW17_04465 [Rhodococcus sp. (in: high G+C Gram-positive bacteria)]|uniref:hypothetical protein n=1 Tax=Rhodococcus sp. TaxID=1831 RepID=UPI003BB2245C